MDRGKGEKRLGSLMAKVKKWLFGWGLVFTPSKFHAWPVNLRSEQQQVAHDILLLLFLRTGDWVSILEHLPTIVKVSVMKKSWNRESKQWGTLAMQQQNRRTTTAPLRLQPNTPERAPIFSRSNGRENETDTRQKERNKETYAERESETG